ncbi:putative glutathione s-transferase [Diaporthe ampelina]|uniref:Putative glutathione s-transferase n=1 Tax=Diaporthe ampelina TaxID=1214573 RepID=A0A0G2FQJ7_9PEZI|nr:putative glutathione s-transferase [Diaporthe ampelina]
MTARLRKIEEHLNMANEADIHLYTTGTPNGIKVSILLEELGLPYQTTAIDLAKNTQKEDWFLEINPNGRIPAITDKFGDKTIRLFESGSILLYLVDKYDKDHKISYPHGTEEYYETNNWLFFQNAGLGPMQGQANHFTRYAPEKIAYGIARYQNETRRLYRVLDTALAKSKSGFLVEWSGVDINETPHLKTWLYKLLERPGFEKGRHVPTEHKAFKMAELPEEELDKLAAGPRAWVQAGMHQDAAK